MAVPRVMIVGTCSTCHATTATANNTAGSLGLESSKRRLRNWVREFPSLLESWLVGHSFSNKIKSEKTDDPRGLKGIRVPGYPRENIGVDLWCRDWAHVSCVTAWNRDAM